MATAEHVAAVTARVAAVAPDDLRDLVTRVAQAHEERDPERLRRAVGGEAAAVALAFGEVWKVRGPADCEDYAHRHGARLRPLLLFELAHEGAATEEMRAAARAGGLEHEFEGWERRLGDR